MAETGTLCLPPIDDFHVHLRQPPLMHALAAGIPGGGCGRVLVMPNTVPPVVTCEQAARYRADLEKSEPSVEYLMTLFLCPAVTVDDLRQNAKNSNVYGLKLYPRGVTTNSSDGVAEDLSLYDPVFKAMSELGLSLHIHGEMPGKDPLHAENAFLPQLTELAVKYPLLKIVLEHVSTAAAIELVGRLGPNVAATITVHHIDVVTSDVLDNGTVYAPHLYCKPLPKSSEDRAAIRSALKSASPKFFLGSDSAPHLTTAKEGVPTPAAGVYTGSYLLAYLADAFDRLDALDKLESFACVFGARFFGLPLNKDTRTQRFRLVKKSFKVPEALFIEHVGNVRPYRGTEVLRYTVEPC